jgi:hypothetical protein
VPACVRSRTLPPRRTGGGTGEGCGVGFRRCWATTPRAPPRSLPLVAPSSHPALDVRTTRRLRLVSPSVSRHRSTGVLLSGLRPERCLVRPVTQAEAHIPHAPRRWRARYMYLGRWRLDLGESRPRRSSAGARGCARSGRAHGQVWEQVRSAKRRGLDARQADANGEHCGGDFGGGACSAHALTVEPARRR